MRIAQRVILKEAKDLSISDAPRSWERFLAPLGMTTRLS